MILISTKQLLEAAIIAQLRSRPSSIMLKRPLLVNSLKKKATMFTPCLEIRISTMEISCTTSQTSLLDPSNTVRELTYAKSFKVCKVSVSKNSFQLLNSLLINKDLIFLDMTEEFFKILLIIWKRTDANGHGKYALSSDGSRSPTQLTLCVHNWSMPATGDPSAKLFSVLIWLPETLLMPFTKSSMEDLTCKDQTSYLSTQLRIHGNLLEWDRSITLPICLTQSPFSLTAITVLTVKISDLVKMMIHLQWNLQGKR